MSIPCRLCGQNGQQHLDGTGACLDWRECERRITVEREIEEHDRTPIHD